MNIIDALKRLERAGQENSRTTQKLKDAVFSVACEIAEKMPVGIWSGDYEIIRKYSNAGSAIFLEKDGIQYNYEGEGYLHSDFNAPLHGPGREDCLQFAKEIAGGLLDKFADAMESRQAAVLKAIKVLEAVTVE